MSSQLVKNTLVLAALLMLIAAPGNRVSGAEGGDGWRAEFNDVCGRTADAQDMTTEMLQSLLGRCDRLKPQIEKLEDPERKVMRTRLRMCCDLYRFMVETRTTATH